MGKSIFELADKFGYDSPWEEKWDNDKTKNDKKPKIVSVDILKSTLKQNPFLNKINKKTESSNIIPITVFINTDGWVDKVEVVFENKVFTAFKEFAYSHSYQADIIFVIPPPFQYKDINLNVNVFDLLEKKIVDTTICKFKITLGGNILNTDFVTNEDDIKFIELQNSGEITPKEIKKFRDLILVLSQEKRTLWYNELQKHVPYHSQRDNENPKADVMCNLTTLAMNLEYLGIECPDSKNQFEDWLEKKRVEKKYPDRTNSESWIKLAKDFKVEAKNIPLWTTKSMSEDKIRTVVKEKLKNYLDKGDSISLSAFPSCTGHIVKLQAITEKGLIIDDPFGMINDFSERDKCGSGYKNTKNSKDSSIVMGKDNLWTWSDIKKTQLKYAIVFSLSSLA